MSVYDLIIEKNIDKSYFVPRSQKLNNPETTIDDVLYKSKNNQNKKFVSKSKYLDKGKINVDDKKIIKNNKNVLLNFIKEKVEKINEDKNFL